MCVLRNHLGQWEQAIPWCEKSIAGIPQVFYPYVELAAANAWAGRDREAKDDRHPIAESPSRLHRAGLGRKARER